MIKHQNDSQFNIWKQWFLSVCVCVQVYVISDSNRNWLLHVLPFHVLSELTFWQNIEFVNNTRKINVRK